MPGKIQYFNVVLIVVIYTVAENSSWFAHSLRIWTVIPFWK